MFYRCAIFTGPLISQMAERRPFKSKFISYVLVENGTQTFRPTLPKILLGLKCPKVSKRSNFTSEIYGIFGASISLSLIHI